MDSKKRSKNWTAIEKLQAVVAYEGLEESEQGQYLRSHGLYSVEWNSPGFVDR